MKGRLTKQEKMFLKKMLNRIDELRRIARGINKRQRNFLPIDGSCGCYWNIHMGRCTKCFMSVGGKCIAMKVLMSPSRIETKDVLKEAIEYANRGNDELPYENEAVKIFAKRLIELNYIIQSNYIKISSLTDKDIAIKKLFNNYTFGSFCYGDMDYLIDDCYELIKED